MLNIDIKRSTLGNDQFQSAIDVFVHHLGSVIRSSDGSLVNTMTLTHVDTFVVNFALKSVLQEFSPSSRNRRLLFFSDSCLFDFDSLLTLFVNTHRIRERRSFK